VYIPGWKLLAHLQVVDDPPFRPGEQHSRDSKAAASLSPLFVGDERSPSLDAANKHRAEDGILSYVETAKISLIVCPLW
jgi:hypothetical protein